MYNYCVMAKSRTYQIGFQRPVVGNLLVVPLQFRRSQGVGYVQGAGVEPPVLVVRVVERHVVAVVVVRRALGVVQV